MYTAPPHGRYRYTRQNPAVRLLNFLCAVLLTLVFVAGIILFILWLSLRPHRPRFYLVDFSIPNLGQQSGLANSPITFSLADQNPNRKIGIYYDQILGTVYYDDQVVGSGQVMYPFYQPNMSTITIQGALTAVGPVPTDPVWPQFAGEVSAGNVEMRLTLMTMLRFHVKIWDTRQHRMKVQCNFRLRGDGALADVSRNTQCSLFFI